MENQHRKIIGYRELNEKEIADMNAIKTLGVQMGQLIQSMEASVGIDKRWLAIGKTDLQKGFMALTRAVAKPDFF